MRARSNAHEYLENEFFDLHRLNDTLPTNDEYLQALKPSLLQAGATENEAIFLTDQARQQQQRYGLVGSDKIPVNRIPKKWIRKRIK